jgi:hypothetical protein
MPRGCDLAGRVPRLDVVVAEHCEVLGPTVEQRTERGEDRVAQLGRVARRIGVVAQEQQSVDGLSIIEMRDGFGSGVEARAAVAGVPCHREVQIAWAVGEKGLPQDGALRAALEVGGVAHDLVVVHTPDRPDDQEDSDGDAQADAAQASAPHRPVSQRSLRGYDAHPGRAGRRRQDTAACRSASVARCRDLRPL